MMQINKSISFLLLLSTPIFFCGCHNADKTAIETPVVKTLVSIVHLSFATALHRLAECIR